MGFGSDFQQYGEPVEVVSSPDLHIKGTTQSAELKIDLDRESMCCPVGGDHRNTGEGGREGWGWGWPGETMGRGAHSELTPQVKPTWVPLGKSSGRYLR